MVILYYKQVRILLQQEIYVFSLIDTFAIILTFANII